MDKICHTCKICKPFSDFHKDKTKKDGLLMYCKICRNEKIKLYRNKQIKYCVVYRLEYKGFYYVGSTDNIKNRLTLHKSVCFNINSTKYNLKIYKNFRELGLTKDNFYKEIKKTIILKNLDPIDLKSKENDYINLDDEFCLNDRNENRTKEYIKQYRKEYSKEYYETHKEQKKQYREKNKEKIKQYNKEYREKKKNYNYRNLIKNI